MTNFYNFNKLKTVNLFQDKTHYKMPTIKRRLNHKMVQDGVKTIKEYIKLLLKNDKEVETLYKDLLINVTSFFRDKEVFQFLKKSTLPKLLKSKKTNESLRIWIPACSSGEEAYTMAMLLTELQDKKNKKVPVQIFATDLSDRAIIDARIGKYSKSDVKTIPKKYIERFFTKTGDNYFINKEIREQCVFAPHNILRDPPFSRMDFISCRNLLIYFDTAAQKKIFSTLHFSLKEGGYLLLGKAEAVGTSSQLFTLQNNKFKIYLRKKNTDARKILELTPRFPRTILLHKKTNSPAKNTATNSMGFESAIDTALLSKHMPACAVVNKDMEILQFRGPVSLFLKHAQGKATLNILKMIQPEFAFELRNAIQKVIKTKQPVEKTGIEINPDNNQDDSVSRRMSFEVSYLNIEWDEPLLLIVFRLEEQTEKLVTNNKSEKISVTMGNAIKEKRIKNLLKELNNSRAEMNTIIETQENTYEELQVANEEIVSSNEEFQTLNEELETSKEEIEASNEELISTNHELQMRNDLLTESHEYSEAITDTIHESMLIIHKDFRVKSANKSYYKKFLVKQEDTEGVSLFELGNNQWNIPKLREELTDILTKNNNFENLEVTHTFPGIGEKTMLLNARLIVQKANKEKLILLAIEDITERTMYYQKENIVRKKAENKFRGFLESAPDAIVIVNRDGKIQLVNSQTEKLFGYKRSEIIGQEIEMLMPSRYHDDHHGHRKGFSENAQTREMGGAKDLFARHKDGREFPVEISLSALVTEEGSLISAAIRDISIQKKIEKELVEAKVLAEEATIQAQKATEIAENAMQAKQQFLSTMSHEIRTPMNAIIGFTKVVMKTALTAKQKEYVSAIKTSGDALIVLINDILDLAKVDSGKMVFEETPFRMASSISAMLHLFETKIQEKNLLLVKEYDKKIPEVLIGDPVRLHQIILNLVSNAVKFTSTGKITVRVNLCHEDEKNVSLEFSVTDTGIGLAEDQISTIFENFQQASSETSKLYGGTGLGLAIVKQLVEKQNGTIQVKSKMGEGSTFSFTLSFRKAIAGLDNCHEETGIMALDPDIKNIKVLVVEDIALNQLLMKTLLDDFGFERDIAENGRIAIEKLKTKSYDIILMDLQMPEINGFEATEYIRKTLNSKIPIIALTADVTTVDLEKCKAVGMNDYIAKPVDERLLYNKIVGLVKKAVPTKLVEFNEKKHTEDLAMNQTRKHVNLHFLRSRTNGNPQLMMEMIALYLKQTPPIILAMKQGIHDKDWKSVQAAVHKMIPSFLIMGIDKEYENIAKKIVECVDNEQQVNAIPGLVKQLENHCIIVFKELEEEYKVIENVALLTTEKQRTQRNTE